MKPLKEYRAQAQAQMKLNYGANIYIKILKAAITAVLIMIPFGTIALGGALSVGLAAFYLQIAREGKANVKNLFKLFTGNIGNAFVLDALKGLFLVLWTMVPVVGIFIAIVKSYSYAMAQFILIDNPDMNGCKAITASRLLMKGKKWKLFLLELSYIGWYLLNILTLGILAIWINPRVEVARAAFYDSIKPQEV
ncbi:MAG: DUF975 family protein [Clostridia bacterium]|nr:DUF975 family protein [Clostridia bacterium]